MILTEKYKIGNIARTFVLFFFAIILICAPTKALSFNNTDVRNIFRFSHLSFADGLSSQRVFSIIEGSDHAIWIATKNGVVRYNGTLTKQYALNLDEPRYSSLASRIIKLYKSADGKLYAFTNSGKIFRYDIVSDSFVLCCDLSQHFSQEIILNDIAVINGRYWLALSTGLYCLNDSGKPQCLIKNSFVNDLTDTKDGIFAGTNSGLFYTSLSKPQAQLVFPNLAVQSSYYDASTNRIFIGTFNDGIMLGDISSRKLFPASPDIPHKPVRAITPLNNETMLVGVDGGGVAGIERSTGRMQFLLSTDDDHGAVLHGNGIYAICLDEWGNVWIGSYSGGVDVAYSVFNGITIVSHDYQNPQSLFNDNVNAIMDDGDGNIYYATDRGVSTFNKTTATWSHSMPGMVCLNFARDINGRLLVATYGAGVMAIDGTPVYTKENGKLKTDYAFSLYNDGKGKLWIGCLDGDLACISLSGERFYPIQNVQTITSTADGRIAIATANGFYAIDNMDRVSHYFSSGEFHSADVNTYVMSMLFTSPNEVWLGTDGGGVYIYNMQLHSYRQLTTDNGLPSNSVKGIMRDGQGRIWITTDNGIGYTMQKKNSRIVAVSLPQSGIEFNRDAMAVLSDGRLAFGSTSGALVINKNTLLAINYKAPIQITDIQISGLDKEEAGKVRPHIYEMLSKGRVVLPYSQNTFTLSFESINLKYQYDIKYQYYIEGRQGNALQTVDDGQILFNSLAPGKYRIHLRSVRRSTGQVISERVLELQVKQPWWNSAWAWLAYILIIVTSIYVIWKAYRARLQREYDADRIDFFVNTAHDIRTPLSLTLAPLNDIANDNSLSKQSRTYLDIARRNGKQLMTLISTLLDFQKIDTRNVKLQVEQLDLHSLLEQACSRFHLLAEQKNINLSMAPCPTGATVWMDPKAAVSILDNLISNALKYTRENGRVEVGGRIDESHVYIYVSDNGIGIPEKSKQKIFSKFFRAENALRTRITGSGLGLSLVNKLVTLQKGTVSFESEEGKGTTFTVTMPRNYNGQLDNTVAEQILDRKETNEQQLENEGSERPTILFVDDNLELRNYMTLAFGKDFVVITEPDAQSAIDYLAENTCDIIISDVMMPEMQGDEFCRKVKENEATSFIPVILLTAKVGRDYTINGLNCGADDYISKPFDPAVLQAKVESILRNRQAIRNYYLHRATAIVNDMPAESNQKGKGEQTSNKPVEVEAEMDEAGKEFIDKATQIVKENMSDESFDINQLCREMAMSRTLFYNRLKALTGKTPQDFIRIMRLERAAKLIDDGATVFVASTDTGFTNVKYFSTLFKKHFGVSPSKYHKD